MFNFLYQVLGWPLGWIMWAMYQLTNNYGLSLFLFTLIIRIVLVPVAIKQQKSTAKLTVIQPKIQELQKKYANNREKLTEEMNKLYKQQGYSAAAGCLPMMIQMLVLFGLIDVIYRPLKHILRLSPETIDIGAGIIGETSNRMAEQIFIIQGVHTDAPRFTAMGADVVEKIMNLDLNFLGINLGLQPSMSMFGDIFTQGFFDPILLVPILSGLSAVLVTVVTMRNTKGTAADAGAAGGSMKGMMMVMPVMSFMIAFNVPAGVGVYWFYSNIYALIQSILLHKFYNPKEMAQQAQQEYEERQEQERQERIEAKKRAKEGKLEDKEKAMTQKELNRKKLAEARKRDAEKYGEEYVEVTDDDLR